MTMYFPARLRSRTVRGGATAGGAAPPLPSVDIDAVKAGLTLSVTENFDGTTLNASRWRVLAEPGRGQTSSLAPTLEWPDHWGHMSATDTTPSYIHNPAMVTVADSVLRLTWSRIGGVWNVGGITSAASYGAPRGTLFNAPTRGLVEFRFRVPVMPAGSGGFGAVWRMPRDDAFGVWPASGEIDDLEWTQHPDGLTVNGSGRNAYVNIPNNWGVNLAGNSSALTNPAVNILDGQWHTGATHQYANGDTEVLDFYLDGRRFHRATIPAASAARVRVPFVWLLTAQGPGFWGIGLPPDNTWLSWQVDPPVFEVDWLRHWVPTTPPPAIGDKPAVLYGAADYGLSLVFQDSFHVSDPPNLADDLWAFSPGSRNAPVAPPSTDINNTVRMATVEVGGKPARRVHKWIQPTGGWTGWAHTADIAGRAEMCVAVDWFVPTNWRYESATGRRDGKTCIGLTTAPAGPLPFEWHNAGDGGNRYPWEQGGGSGGACAHHGLNFSSPSNGDPYVGVYSHTLGYSGIASQRTKIPPTGQAGIAHPLARRFTIPRGRWVTIEFYIKIDTNGRNGVITVWMTDNGVTTREIHWSDLDLGGMLGVRNYATMPRQNNFTWGATPRSLNITTPALCRGLMSRHMYGGWPGGDSQSERNTFWNVYYGEWYTFNWRLYGK